MSDGPSGRRFGVILSWSVSLALVLALAVIWPKFHKVTLQLEDVVGNFAKKSQILSQMKANLLRSVEAEKSAVLSDSDEETEAFAAQSQQAIDDVEKGRKELDALIDSSIPEGEWKSLQEFDRCWAEYLKTEQIILDLAVKNTNYKAAKLSLTEANDAVQRLAHDLSELLERDSSSGNCEQMAIPVLHAVTACFHSHYLQMTHIRSAVDSEMDQIEVEMKENNAVVEKSISTLAGLTDESGRALLKDARKAYEDYLEVTKEIISLSRQNTDIKGMELSLGKKRAVTSECYGILVSLQETVQSRAFKATR
jgi:hypothetical protein